jgi:hypothetical protein
MLHRARCICPALELIFSALDEITDGMTRVPDYLLYHLLAIALKSEEMTYCALEGRAA